MKKWRVSDVVLAVCKDRGITASSSREGSWILDHCYKGQSFEDLSNKCSVSLPEFFKVRGHRELPHGKYLFDVTADAIVAEATRLGVPRRA